MPHALTPRQRAYLEYIREYIREQESTPRLEEIAGHFEVTPPAVHKTLKALMNKGFLYFERSSEAGFYIRLIERVGMAEVVVQVPIVGEVNQYGEMESYYEDEKNMPEEPMVFPAIFSGVEAGYVMALRVMEDIPEASIQTNDIIIFDLRKKAQPGDTCIAPFGDRTFLIRILGKTPGKNMPHPDLLHEYPIPESLVDPELDSDYEDQLHWRPLVSDETNTDWMPRVSTPKGWVYKPYPPDMSLGTALRLIRPLHYNRYPDEQT